MKTDVEEMRRLYAFWGINPEREDRVDELYDAIEKYLEQGRQNDGKGNEGSRVSQRGEAA